MLLFQLWPTHTLRLTQVDVDEWRDANAYAVTHIYTKWQHTHMHVQENSRGAIYQAGDWSIGRGNLSCDGCTWGLWQRCHIVFGWDTGAMRGYEWQRAWTQCTDIMNLGNSWSMDRHCDSVTATGAPTAAAKKGRKEERKWIECREEMSEEEAKAMIKTEKQREN